MSAPLITVVGSVNLDFVATAKTLPAPGETVTGATLAEMLTSPIAREIIATKLRRVVIRNAEHVDVKLVDDALIVEVEASEPITGRPSSARLRSAIGDLL